jgi:hypothetical protein
MLSDLQSKEREGLQSLLEPTFVVAGVAAVVLSGEDECCEPEVGEDPGERGEVSLVRFLSRQYERWDVEEDIDCSLRRVNLYRVRDSKENLLC